MQPVFVQDTSSTKLEVPETVAQYLTFVTNQQRFAINIRDLQEIIEITTITPVPFAPAFIRGVINLRGQVITVIDLAARLTSQFTSLQAKSCIMLVKVNSQDGKRLLGVLVDEAKEILTIPKLIWQAPAEFNSTVRPDFIEAIANVNGLVITLLAVNSVLSLTELSQLTVLPSPQLHIAHDNHPVG